MDILKRNVAVVTVQNRAARALGNLAMDPESSTLIHSEGKSHDKCLSSYIIAWCLYFEACVPHLTVDVIVLMILLRGTLRKSFYF